MSTKERLENSLKDAMRAQDELRKRTLRMVIAAIRFAEKEKNTSLDEAAVLAILQKEMKSRQESLDEARHANRPDLAVAAQDEMSVLEEFLPRRLDPAELEALVREVIAEVGATTAKETGQVMRALMPRLQGRATGDQAGQVVRRLLAG